MEDTSFHTRLARYFGGSTRKRGQEYFQRGRVRIQRGSDTTVQAAVRGSAMYDVELEWAVGRLSGWCDCPHFESGYACKHLFATLLAAEAKGHLSAAVTATKLILDLDFGEGQDEFDDEIDFSPSPRHVETPRYPRTPEPPSWKIHLTQVANLRARFSTPHNVWPEKRQLLYVVNVPNSLSASKLVLTLQARDRKLDGSWSRFNALNFKRDQIAQMTSPEDREILSRLVGGQQHYTYGYYSNSYETIPSAFQIAHPLAGMMMPMLTQTGRCYIQATNSPDDLTLLTWDENDSPWNFKLEMNRLGRSKWTVSGILHRGEERMDLAAPRLITQGGLVFTHDRVARLAEETAFEWLLQLRKAGCIEAANVDRDDLLSALLCERNLPPLEVPEEIRYEEVTSQPKCCLRVSAADQRMAAPRLHGELSFDYDGQIALSTSTSRGWYDAAGHRFMQRNFKAEAAAAAWLRELGARYLELAYPGPMWQIAPTKLPRIVHALVQKGWSIEAEGKVFRRPGAFQMQVSSGVDWFELHGEVEYGDSRAKLPALLEALRRGENMVQLDDGNYGLLPEEWLRRFGPLAGMGTTDDGHIRFRQNQAGLLDALLAAQPDATCDETFARVRSELSQFQGIQAAEQPAGFHGQLRDYQREGLGWMEFLRRFSFGGCLADDMGVGKTAQVLALLETRRELREAGKVLGPSLVVVPKSLVFNWKQEAERFTPQLRVLDHTGTARTGNNFDGYDIVLTTYGTLRRDALRLKDVEFDYVVLDEAQAVKNASTESSKAVRLLRGTHRLALSGTPVENHLGELWTLFEFLNPGMLGAASVFKLAGGALRNPEEDTRRLLAQSLRPFILRRTKEQVARELPAKTEQTIYCEMEPPQRKLYNELRQHYRTTLLKKIESNGMAKSKIQVLEALLRLRQAACHPGLIDPKHAGDPSAKLEVLLEQLREVLEEGHKALVFSQFTSLLRLVRNRLESEGIVYEYLDGQTRDRQARVERFQSDAECRLFLISLKAGGLGLNLTAADYVFLLDPWWNPAVEMQAVDRAHRIGQTRQVFAYRLIARDTVEEKVLELQKSKRDLAEAIISADNSLIRDLRQEDLEVLLS